MPNGTLIHIGAGGALTAPEAPARVLLVEPHPVRARALERLAEGDARVTVHPVALAARDGTAELRSYNLAAHDGIAPPSALTDLFPGLRETGRQTVRAVTVNGLLAQAGPLPAPVDAIVDAPGLEGVILRDLLVSEAGAQLRRIMLHGATEPLHEGGTPLSAILHLLEEDGFRIAARDDADPDRPAVTLERRSPRVDPADGLRKERDAALAEAAQLRAEVATLRQTQGVALRLQAMAQTDLRDLQARHAEALRVNRDQEALLRELTPRLQQALHHLQSLPAPQQEALAKPKRKKLPKAARE